MALAQESFNFGGHLHGPLITGPWTQGIQTGRFAGVVGVVQLVDRRKEREVSCDYIVSGFSTHALLEAELDVLGAKVGVLGETLVATGTFARTLTRCTFLGFFREGPVIPAITGIQTWTQRGRLRWTQRSPL